MEDPIVIDVDHEDRNEPNDPSDPNDPSEVIDLATQHRYRVFKKNSPYLYDYLATNSLLWPSLSVQFFPDLEVAHTAHDQGHNQAHDQKPPSTVPDTAPEPSSVASQLAHQRLLVGTFTLGQAVDAIHIYQAPYYRDLNRCINTDSWTYNPEKQEFELPTVAKTKLRSLQTINHHGDVNKLRYMPQNPDVIASANNVGDLFVYNRTKHGTIRKLGEEHKVNEPQLRLVNGGGRQVADIFALDWNKQREAFLVSASMGGHVNVYDIRGQYHRRSRDHNVIHEVWGMVHSAAVNDVEWAPMHDSVFLTADDAGSLSVVDTRVSGKPLRALAGGEAKNSLSINPNNEFCVASGDCAGFLEIWDLRCFHKSAKRTQAHTDAMTQVKWHPKFRSVLGTASADRLVRIFDVAEAEDVPLFSHEGHMLGVNDFDWSMHEDWMVASVADDNSLHMWKPAQHAIRNVY